MPATLWAWQVDDAVHFETHVRPILKAHCWRCHGEEEELKGKLDTRTARLLLTGGDSGPALVPGDHANSLIHARAASGEMPPDVKPLTPAQIATLARWIDSGAKTLRDEPTTLAAGDTFTVEERAHWSFSADPPSGASQFAEPATGLQLDRRVSFGALGSQGSQFWSSG